jgi:hypothetical protein
MVPVKRNHDALDIFLATYDEANINPFKTPVFQMEEMHMPLLNLTYHNSKQNLVACCLVKPLLWNKARSIMWNMEPVDPGTRGDCFSFLVLHPIALCSEALHIYSIA